MVLLLMGNVVLGFPRLAGFALQLAVQRIRGAVTIADKIAVSRDLQERWGHDINFYDIRCHHQQIRLAGQRLVSILLKLLIPSTRRAWR